MTVDSPSATATGRYPYWRATVWFDLHPDDPERPPKSVRLGRVGTVPVYGRAGALLYVAMFAVVGTMSVLLARALGDGGSVALGLGGGFVLALVLTGGLHEAGHAVAVRAFGQRVVYVVFMVAGAAVGWDIGAEGTTPRTVAVIALAGPAVNVVLAGLAELVLHFGHSGSVSSAAGQVLFFNVGVLVFNLIPLRTRDPQGQGRRALTDGGLVLEALRVARTGQQRPLTPKPVPVSV